jgi:hypothetical protein
MMARRGTRECNACRQKYGTNRQDFSDVLHDLSPSFDVFFVF